MANTIASDASVIPADVRGWGKPPVVRATDGTVYSGYVDNTGLLNIYKSINTGTTWTLEESLTSYADGIKFFNLDIDGSGNLYVCINHGTSNDIALCKRDAGTGVWSEVKTMALGIDIGVNVARNVLVSHSKLTPTRIYMSWFMTQVWTGYPTVFLSYSDNAGVDWTEVNFNRYGVADYNFYMYSVDSDPISGRVFVYCLQSVGNGYAGEVTQFESDGSSPAQYVAVTGGSSGPNFTGGDMVTDVYRNVWVAYNETTVRNDITVESYNGGVVTGLAVFNSAAPTGDFVYGSITLGSDGVGNVFLFYQRTSTGKSYYAKYTRSTDTWGSETQLQDVDTYRLMCEKRNLIDSELFFYTFYID
jgi:hypothetical protein